MSEPFIKMFSSITESSVWCEPHTTVRVWVAMLAKADRLGRVHASVPGLAHLARVSLEECKSALATFQRPDPYSRTPDHEGRRIEPIDGGWLLLNYQKYRELGAPVKNGLDAEGYVYYIGVPGSDRVKIGFSKNPWARLGALRTATPGLEVLATEKGTMLGEKDRHREFTHDHIEREWFRASPSLNALIAALAERDSRKRTVTTVAKKSTTVVTEEEEEEEEEVALKQQLSASPDGDAPPVASDPIPYQAVVDAYNRSMANLPKVRELTTKRRTLIRSAWQAAPKRRSMRFWAAYFELCAEDSFLNGTGPYTNGHENWRPSFDYLLRAEVVTRVVERALDANERAKQGVAHG